MRQSVDEADGQSQETVSGVEPMMGPTRLIQAAGFRQRVAVLVCQDGLHTEMPNESAGLQAEGGYPGRAHDQDDDAHEPQFDERLDVHTMKVFTLSEISARNKLHMTICRHRHPAGSVHD